MNVGMMLFPRLTQLDLTGPYEVLSRMPDSTVLLIAETLDPVAAAQGLRILPDLTFAESPALDLIFVPGGPGINAMLTHAPFLTFLREQGQQAAYVTSVCTGSLLLAAAGLLNGYRATTHWLSLDLLALFENVTAVNERVVIDRNRITGAGVTSGIDFGLVLAAQLHGPEIAQRIQLSIEYNPAPPFTGGSPDTAAPNITAAIRAVTQANQQTRRAIIQDIVQRDQHNPAN